MNAVSYQSDYSRTHMKRINHLISYIVKYIKPQIKIGVIGYSVFDMYIRQKLAGLDIYNIVPKADFIDEENAKKESVIVYDLTSNTIVESSIKLDIVVFTEVLEHLFADDSLIIENLSRLMKRDGLLFFSVPNISSFGKVLALIIGQNPYMKKSEILSGVFGGYGHIREYSFREVRELLHNHFKIIKIQGWNDYPNIFGKIVRLLPRTYSQTIFAICRKL